MSEHNLISDWLNNTLSKIRPMDKRFTIYIKEDYKVISKTYKTSETIVVNCKSGWTAIHTDNIKVIKDVSDSFGLTKIKNSTIIGITSKFEVNKKEYLATMPSELKEKLIKCETKDNQATFTFIECDSEWEPESKIKSLNDFKVVNITKLNYRKYKESIHKTEQNTGGSNKKGEKSKSNKQPKQSQQITKTPIVPQAAQPKDTNNIISLSEQELDNLILDSNKDSQVPQHAITTNIISLLTEQDLDNLILDQNSEIQAQTQKQEQNIMQVIQTQKIQNQKKQIKKQQQNIQENKQNQTQDSTLIEKDETKNVDKRTTNNDKDSSISSPPKDIDEFSFSPNSQMDVSINTVDVKKMLNTEFIFEDSSPLPDKLLDPISPQPVIFNIRELDTPTQDKIVEEMLYQPDQTIYVPPTIPPPPPINIIQPNRLKKITGNPKFYKQKTKKTIEESIEDHQKGASTLNSANLVKTVLEKFNPDVSLITETNIKQHKINNINKIFINNIVTHAPALKTGEGVSTIIKNKNITATSTIINERIIISDFTISNFTFKCATIYAPAKEHLRFKWFKENLSPELLDCDIIAGDFNINALDSKNQTNIYVTNTLKEAGLRELLPSSGVTFPRNNSIIDRIFLSKKLFHLHPASTTKKTKIKSDHHIIMLNLKIPNYFKETKSNNRLWRQNLEVLKMNRTAKVINKEIKYFEIKSKNKNSKHFKTDICQRWILIKDEIKKKCNQLEIQHANQVKFNKNTLINNIENCTNSIDRTQLRDQLDRLLKEEYIKKLSNQTNIYINYNETPSRFLTAKLKTKTKSNAIKQILNPISNILVTDQEGILETARKYYERLYECKPCNEESHNYLLQNNTRLVDPEISKKLAYKIEEHEIELSIEKLQEGKAPGIDGLIPTFYKNHKDIILPMLLELFNHFIDKGIPPDFKQGVLISIYKNKGDPNNLDNYRPITLLNVDYKIYSKIINNRILRFLNNVISPFQTGFVPRRILHDNIITLNSVIDMAQREIQVNSNIAPIITFYDFEKAFDSISHKAIVRTLSNLKLPLKFINAITNLLMNSSTAVYINNKLSSKFISKRGTKQGDPISPTIFALVVEYDTATIASGWMDHYLMDMTIKRFCRATSAAININKSTCITLRPESNTIYKKATTTERYLGFNFKDKGVISKIPELSTKIKGQLTNWNKHSSTYQGRIILAKTYALSQLTFHNYISSINSHCQIENTVTKFIFNTKSKNTMSSSRRYASYSNGGLNLWNLETRATAQRAWIYERHLHQVKNKTPSSFNEIWNKEKSTIFNPSDANHQNRPTRTHVECFQAWVKLKPNRLTSPHYEALPELKIIYKDLMNIQSPNYDSFNPTPGQIEIMKKINRTTLPFIEIKRIVNLKGRDILWRIALKALPKVFNKPCIWCDEIETSEHIFFKCNSHLNNSQICIDYIQEKCGGSKFKWSIEVLNKLDLPLTANAIAIICENIWRRRNKRIHEGITLQNLRKEILVHELIKTQTAAWERTKNTIYKVIRQENKATNIEQTKKFKLIISKHLERFSKHWNSPIHIVTLPSNFKKYITSINTLYNT
ncbi:hypothetical protein ACTFIZ_006456 [Dictyostelium cf. discoideum]